MAIYRLLENVPLGPEEIQRLTDAYERTLSALCIRDRNDPLTEFIARKIFELGQTGLKDPSKFLLARRGTQAFLGAKLKGTDASTWQKKTQAGARLGPRLNANQGSRHTPLTLGPYRFHESLSAFPCEVPDDLPR